MDCSPQKLLPPQPFRSLRRNEPLCIKRFGSPALPSVTGYSSLELCKPQFLVSFSPAGLSNQPLPLTPPYDRQLSSRYIPPSLIAAGRRLVRVLAATGLPRDWHALPEPLAGKDYAIGWCARGESPRPLPATPQRCLPESGAISSWEMAATAGRSLLLLLLSRAPGGGGGAALTAAGCFPGLGRHRQQQQQRHRTVSGALGGGVEAGTGGQVLLRRGAGGGGGGGCCCHPLPFAPEAGRLGCARRHLSSGALTRDVTPAAAAARRSEPPCLFCPPSGREPSPVLAQDPPRRRRDRPPGTRATPFSPYRRVSPACSPASSAQHQSLGRRNVQRGWHRERCCCGVRGKEAEEGDAAAASAAVTWWESLVSPRRCIPFHSVSAEPSRVLTWVTEIGWRGGRLPVKEHFRRGGRTLVESLIPSRDWVETGRLFVVHSLAPFKMYPEMQRVWIHWAVSLSLPPPPLPWFIL